MPAIRLPFRRLNAQQWLNAVWALLALFYALFTAGAVWAGRLFEYVGSDYLAFRASADIALRYGFAEVYDLDRQSQAQREIHDANAPQPFPSSYAPVPTPYLPAFILPLTLLLLLPPVPGFVLWAILNLVVLALYLRRVIRAVGLGDGPRLLAMALLSGPVFANWFFGQVSIWLLICLGEFLLRGERGQDLAAGLWLGGLLMKPQILILLLPGLLLQRRFKMLLGFAIVALLVLGLSLVLAGPAGLVALANLVLHYSEGLPTNHPEVMINWRSLMVHLEPLLSATAAWVVAIAGMALTTAAGLALWLRPAPPASPRFAIATLGTYAATCAVTWHAHVNLAAPTIVLLLILYGRRWLSPVQWEVWLLVPALIFPIAFLAVPAIAHDLVGLSLFVLSLYLVAWTSWRLWRPGPTGAAAVQPGVG